jgi:hypothetical protein
MKLEKFDLSSNVHNLSYPEKQLVPTKSAGKPSYMGPTKSAGELNFIVPAESSWEPFFIAPNSHLENHPSWFLLNQLENHHS